jgi:hypothetical protein
VFSGLIAAVHVARLTGSADEVLGFDESVYKEECDFLRRRNIVADYSN